jgi:hypothetical protein
MDLSKIRKVSNITNTAASQQYDLAYSAKTEKFRLSNQAWDTLRMDVHGFDYYEDGDRVLLARVPEEDAAMWERRKSQATGEGLDKGRERVNRPMADFLTTKYPNVENFTLKPAGKDGDILVFEVLPWDNKIGSGLRLTNVETKQTAPQQTQETGPSNASSTPVSEDIDDIDAFFEEEVAETISDPFND